MSNENNVMTMSTESSLVKSSILLADGTVLNLNLNGTEYESETPIADEVLSEENLSNVTIDGVNKGKMKLNSKYPFGSGTRFSLREMTEDEKTIERLNAELTQTQVGLAEVFEMLIATSFRKGTINPKTGKPYTIDDVPSVIRADVDKAVLEALDLGELAQ